MSQTAPISRAEVRAEMDEARERFARLLEQASAADLRRGTNGTKWTNQQLLFHMLFGYLIVAKLLWLVKGFGRLPGGASRAFAGALNAAATPFHLVNYWGSCGGGTVFSPARMLRRMDRVIAALQRQLDRDSDAVLARRMHFPTRWDPFFAEVMTVADVYHYGTQHFDFHAQQLTLTPAGQ